MGRLLLVLVGLAFASAAVAAAWRAELPEAKPVGQGEFRFLGFRIYSAQLWSEHRPFKADRPFALQLTYHRSITRQRFVETSVDEMRRIQGEDTNPQLLERWAAEMERAFIDVEPGDELIGVYLPGVGCRFYSRQRLLADIRDPVFAQAFFSIWLDPKTRDRGLRARLLGATQ